VRRLIIQSTMDSMTANRDRIERSLAAILSRIDVDIAETGTLLLASLTTLQRKQTMDELAYLRAERRNVARKLKPK
jgi:1,2-phenylacetyl-CoA epoxidase catalytic subunit